MVARTAGPFEYYSEIYPGVTGDTIRMAVDPVDGHVSSLGTMADELQGDERRILEATEGDITHALANTPFVVYTSTRKLAGKAQFAAACTREFAGDVDAFDVTVNGINESYRSMTFSAQHDPDVDVKGGDIKLSDLQDSFRSTLRPRYTAAEQTLETQADATAAKLKTGPTDDAVREFIRLGLMPLAAASFFPTLVLTEADKQAAYNAAVTQTIARLRKEGLLSGPDPDGYYREWLKNAIERGVPLDEIITIARDHDIRPDDFDVLDGLEEVKDPDGKSFFILPSDISGEDARKAVLMTYILNAGTDYGENPTTDYSETPYSSEEIQRIKDRQDSNNWFSYDQDVGFVHGNDGRLATTPNGMLMGLGGDGLQDVYSLNGGTTFGDIFMMNIDDPDDPREALTWVIEHGEGVTADDDGEPTYRRDNLDLDRLLHHEELHSQQWADEGYAGFIAGYLNESVDFDWKGWGPFQAPIPHTTEGEDNHYESDAGLSDGGY